MIKSKLVQGLSILSPEEWNEFEKHLKSEHHPKSDLFTLYKAIKKYSKDLEAMRTKSDFRATYFPSTSEKSFLNLLSRLFQKFEEWLAWLEFRKNKHRMPSLLIKAYNRRGNFKLANATFNKLNRDAAKSKGENLENNQILREAYHYHFFSENPIKSKIGVEILSKLIDFHQNQYKNWAFIYLCQINTWGKNQSSAFDSIKKELLNTLDSFEFQDANKTPRLIFSFLENSNEEKLDELYQVLLNKVIAEGSDLEVFTTLYGISGGLLLWNQGKLKSGKTLFNLYEYGLTSGILTNLGKMSSFRFLNIVSAIVHTRPERSIEEFINKWIHLVEEENQNSTKALSMAYLYRRQGKYKKILNILQTIQFRDQSLDYRAISFEIMAHYMLQDYDTLFGKIYNLRRRIRTSKKLTFSLRNSGFTNFLKVIDLLSKRDFDKQTLNLDNYSPLYFKKWLEEIIKKELP